MPEYHCYFGTGERLRKKVDIDVTDDALAIIEAEHILDDTKQEAVEIWRGTRLIGRTNRRKPAESATPRSGMEDRMSHYRGYFIKDDHIIALADIDATDDAQAMLRANQLLSTGQFFRIEVWQETRVVGGLPAPAPSHEYVTDRENFHASEDDASNVVEFRSRLTIC